MSTSSFLVRSKSALSLLGLAASAAACFPGSGGELVRPAPETAAEALSEQGIKECTGVSRRASPLVVDLKSTERVALDAAMKGGVAVVKYGCDGLQVLAGCSLEGAYAYAGVATKEDVVHLSGSAELAVNLPFTGGKLGGELAASSELDIAMLLVGRRTAGRSVATQTDLKGDCQGATHFVRAATVGAFAMVQGSKGHVATAAELFSIGASASSTSGKRVARRDGDPAVCRGASTSAPAPPDQCQSAISLDLVAFDKAPPVKEKAEAAVVPALANPCPTGFVWSDDKCTPAPGTQAYQCLPDDEAECATQCAKGDARSCHNLGKIAGRSSGPEQRKKAAEAYEKACALGLGDGCAAQGDSLGPGAKQRQALFEKGCDLGSGNGCWSASRELVIKGSGSEEAQRKLLERGCALGFPMACYDLGFLYLAGEGVAKDTARGIELYSRPCRSHIVEACADVGRLFETGLPEGIVGDPGDPMVPIDTAKAIAYYVEACDGGWTPSCGDAGRLLLKGPPADPKRARSYLERGCSAKANYGEACVALGLMFREGTGLDRDPKRAAELFDRACSYQPMHCGPFARALAEGAGVAKDSDRAAGLYERACSSDDEACIAGAELLRGKSADRARAMLETACRETRDHDANKRACALLRKLPKK
jgi:TPR repeat protein